MTHYRYSLDHTGALAVDFEVSVMTADGRVIEERRIGGVDLLTAVVLRRWAARPEIDGVLPITESEFFDLATADAAADEGAFWTDVDIDDPRADTVADALLDVFPGLDDADAVRIVAHHDESGLCVTMPDGEERRDLTVVVAEAEDDRTVIDLAATPNRIRICASGQTVARRVDDTVVVWVVPVADDEVQPSTDRTYALPPDSAPVQHHPVDFVAYAVLSRVDGGTVSIHPGDSLPLRVSGTVIGGLPSDGFLLTLTCDDDDQSALTVAFTPDDEAGWAVEVDCDDATWALVDADPEWADANAITTIKVPHGVVASVVSTRAAMSTPGSNLPTKRFAVS